MDTTHATIKRIEQALTQLQRELQRYGRELPTETFTVKTGNGIEVTAASQPVPVPAVKNEWTEESRKELQEEVRVSYDENGEFDLPANQAFVNRRNKKE